MLEYIKNVHGFQDENITILMDDGQHTEPTYANILAAYKKIVADSQPGDAVFCHYSGHGGKLRDDDGDEKDGYVGDSQSRSIWHPFRFSYRHLHIYLACYILDMTKLWCRWISPRRDRFATTIFFRH